MDQRFFDAPIPGENYTTDTKNFPWHRPPEYTLPDDAIQWSIERLLDDEYSMDYMTMLEMGFTVSDVARMFCMAGIMNGKWSVDIALLIAGPIAHILRIMARGYEIDYEMGYEKAPSPSFKTLKALAEAGDNNTTEELAEDMLQQEDNAEGADFPEDEMSPEAEMGGMASPEEAETGEMPMMGGFM